VVESASLDSIDGESPGAHDAASNAGDPVIEQFTVFGGPIHGLLRRIRILRGGSRPVALGLSIGMFLWMVLIGLAALDGILEHLFRLDVIAGHVRLLVAIPLLFICESYVSPRMGTFVRYLVVSGIVRGNQVRQLAAEIATVERLRDSWISDLVCLGLAFGMAASTAILPLPSGATDVFNPQRAAVDVPLAGLWYWLVCLSVFRYLVFRWLWSLALWVYFLWRLSRIELALVPTHPDNAGGLGYLEVVHTEFSFVIFAISAVYAASFAESVLAGQMTVTSVYPALCFLLAADLVLFVGPLFIFCRTLWECQATGMARYMELSARYVNEFEVKWIGQIERNRSELLGTSDLQSLADLGNSVQVVADMSVAPMSRRLLVSFAIAALLPMLPVALMLLPGDDLAEKLFKLLLGIGG
jgi:hypothetical protein